jgi:hypothetical protein
MVSGCLAHLPQILECCLVATTKPTGGVQPIAITEVWIRMWGPYSLAATPDLDPSLRSLQLGVGVTSSAEGIGHVLRAALTSQPNTANVALTSLMPSTLCSALQSS